MKAFRKQRFNTTKLNGCGNHFDMSFKGGVESSCVAPQCRNIGGSLILRPPLSVIEHKSVGIGRLVTSIILLIFLSHGAHAQEKMSPLAQIKDQQFYRTGVGIGIGWPVAALTVKHFITQRKALEFIAAPYAGGASLTILAEKHAPARRPNIFWYYGGGINAGVYRGESFKDYYGDYYKGKTVVSIGVNAVIGIEMGLRESPFTVSFDVKPRIGVYNPGGSTLEGAVALKYVWD